MVSNNYGPSRQWVELTAMDLYEIIKTLHDERARLDRVIRQIQELQQAGSPVRRPRRPSKTRRGRSVPARREPEPPGA